MVAHRYHRIQAAVFDLGVIFCIGTWINTSLHDRPDTDSLTFFSLCLFAGLYLVFKDFVQGKSLGKRSKDLILINHTTLKPCKGLDSVQRNAILYLPSVFLFTSSYNYSIYLTSYIDLIELSSLILFGLGFLLSERLTRTDVVYHAFYRAYTSQPHRYYQQTNQRKQYKANDSKQTNYKKQQSNQRKKSKANSPRVNPLEKYEKLLDVKSPYTKSLLRKAYLSKLNQYHPDKVANAADEFKALAHERTLAIKEAYESLLKKAAA